MKLKTLALITIFGLMGSVFAGSIEKNANTQKTNKPLISKIKNKKMMMADCAVTIINSSRQDVVVHAFFSDYPSMDFDIDSGDIFEIDLDYFGFCHRNVYLEVEVINDYYSSYLIYSGYLNAGETLRIVPYRMNQIKAEINKK